MNSPQKLILFRQKTYRVAKETPGLREVDGIKIIDLATIAKRMAAIDSGEEADIEYENKTILEYVTMVDSPTEIAKIVRSSPLDKYILFTGTMHNVVVPMQVLIDGRPADTLEAEWRTSDEDIVISDDIKNLEIHEADADIQIPPHI